jgi:hypothetical protein
VNPAEAYDIQLLGYKIDVPKAEPTADS